jgi:hypothetical protein
MRVGFGVVLTAGLKTFCRTLAGFSIDVIAAHNTVAIFRRKFSWLPEKWSFCGVKPYRFVWFASLVGVKSRL